MEFPVRLHFGDFSIPLHAILEFAAFFLGFRYFLYLRKKQHDVIDDSNRIWIIIGATFGALIGSRIVGALEQPERLFTSGNWLLHLYANKTVVGGFLGGLAGVELTKKKLNETRASGDLFVFPILLSLAVGRVGCFSMGVHEETYGIPSDTWLAVDLGDGIPRHPVALYEIVFVIALWFGLARLKTAAPLADGALFKLFMIAYLFFRLALDVIKPHHDIMFGLSTIQLSCVAGLIYYRGHILHPKKLLAAYA